MKSLTDTVCVQRWQAFVLLAMTGFAFGTIIARLVDAMGI